MKVPRALRTLVPLVLFVLGAGGFAGLRASADGWTEAHGPEAFVGAGGLGGLRFAARAGTAVDSDALTVHLDGRDVTDQARVDGRDVSFQPQGLGEGRHEVEFTLTRSFASDSTERWSFVVDTTPPALRIARPRRAVTTHGALRLKGRLSEPATVEINGTPGQVTNGLLLHELDAIPLRPLRIRLTDRAMNQRVVRFRAPVRRRLSLPLRSVHVTPEAWVKKRLKRGILKLVRERRINAIQLDLKDETGMIGYRSKIPLAKRIRSAAGTYDLAKAVREIHALGIPVIGRIVCFADPILAKRSWAMGKRARVIQTTGGQPFQMHGGFTNFANPDVVRYNIDIAEEAARAGVDHILYDYVRRPDAALSALRIPGLEGNASAAVARFVRLTKKRLRPYGALIGVSVFGIASTRPGEISQNIPKLAKHSDYVAPMVYPSHWGPGEYGVPDPINQPYEIVRRSLPDFKRAVKGSGAKVIPWLQDFTLGVYYGPDKVKAQLKAASDAGIRSWILWDPFVTYTHEVLPRMSKRAFAGQK